MDGKRLIGDLFKILLSPIHPDCRLCAIIPF